MKHEKVFKEQELSIPLTFVALLSKSVKIVKNLTSCRDKFKITMLRLRKKSMFSSCRITFESSKLVFSWMTKTM